MGPDQIRTTVYRRTGRELADTAWRQTLAALDGDGGVPIYERAGLPIESDTLDARDQARRAAEDEARERWDQW